MKDSDVDGQALADESIVIDSHRKELNHINFDQPVVDEDTGEPKKDKKGRPKVKSFPAAKVISVVKDHIHDNTENIEENVLWLAKHILWGVGSNELYRILLAFYVGVTVGQKDLTLKIDRESVSPEEIAEIIEKSLHERARQIEELAGDVKKIMGLEDDPQLLPGGED